MNNELKKQEKKIKKISESGETKKENIQIQNLEKKVKALEVNAALSKKNKRENALLISEYKNVIKELKKKQKEEKTKKNETI